MRRAALTTFVALVAVLLAGCGGSGGDFSAGAGGGPGGGTPPAMEQTISNVFGYISQLIASNDANSDPIDINGLTLANDDMAEPTLLN